MNCLHVPQIMMPKKGINLEQWSVIACDQYTSEPEYWEETEKNVGAAPSTLRLTLPEVYLGGEDEAKRVAEIHETMEQYVKDGTLVELPRGFMLVERSFGKAHARNGLVVEIDLETYEYRKGEHSLIRPTEMTVEERIPPRLRVRQHATMELPHIMLLIDDPACEIIEPLVARKAKYDMIYDTDLMQKGGHISGYFIPEGEETTRIMEMIENLADAEVFRSRYNLDKEYPLLNLAVGDGNHSMATAKAAWENIKKNLTEEEQANHPARYCLCEIVNIHDESLEVEPIHRVIFGVEEEELLSAAKTYYEEKGCEFVVSEATSEELEVHGAVLAGTADTVRQIAATTEPVHTFILCSFKGYKRIQVVNPVWGIGVATIQSFLDAYLEDKENSRIDYIHGVDVVKRLGCEKGNVGFFLPEVKKEDLFIGVIKDGVLPRKTFSMGEANEKRYYMECKKLV